LRLPKARRGGSLSRRAIGGEDYRKTRFFVVDEPWQYVFHAVSLSGARQTAEKGVRKRRAEARPAAEYHSNK